MTGCSSRLSTSRREWKREVAFDRCGIGFGGPVDFDDQRVAFSTHVGGWNDFPLTEFLADALGVPAIMDNDANVGALGEAVVWRGPRPRRRCST